MESPLTNLGKLLENVRYSASSYAERLSSNEAVTRAVPIDPVLRALGWDTANPTKVEVERSVRVGRQTVYIDYALLAGEAKLIIEAKRLGGDLNEGSYQIADYANRCGVGSFFITDGIRWWHYKDMVTGNALPVKKLDIANDSLPMVAAYLVQTLDVALISPEPQQEDELRAALELLEQKVSSLETSLAMSSMQSVSMPQQPPIGVQAAMTIADLPWQVLSELQSVTRTRPTKLRFPDGTETSVRTWAQLLVEIVNYSLRKMPELLVSGTILDRAQASVNLVQPTPYPTTIASQSTSFNGRTFYIRTNYSAGDVVANALFLINKLPTASRTTEVAVVLQ